MSYYDLFFLVRIYLFACFCQLSQIRCFAEFFSVALVERTLFCSNVIHIYIYILEVGID